MSLNNNKIEKNPLRKIQKTIIIKENKNPDITKIEKIPNNRINNSKINQNKNNIDKSNKSSHNTGRDNSTIKNYIDHKLKKDSSRMRTTSAASIRKNESSKIGTSINNKSLNQREKTPSITTSEFQRGRKLDISNDSKNHTKISENFDIMLDRFKDKELRKSDKILILKKKIEEEESRKFSEVPKINKSSKYYENNAENFLKRMEVYQFVSDVKKQELKDIELKRIEEEINKNPKLHKKMSNKEIERIISEKMKSLLKAKAEKQEKINKIKKINEQEKLAECTFQPKILDKSRLISKSRINLEMKKSISMPKFLDFDNSKILFKIEDLDTSYTYLNINNKHSFNNQFNNLKRESHSMTRLLNTPKNEDFDSFNIKKEYVPLKNREIIIREINISRKESEIMRELLDKKIYTKNHK